uniref:PH domain-containing protein n=1 Tax=Denticeps clupeoides TaxID=299321 RepID=A0AAY4DAL7_9TELE
MCQVLLSETLRDDRMSLMLFSLSLSLSPSISHNERKVTCKHPVSVASSRASMRRVSRRPGDRCRPSRSSKKVHNFGKRSNSIKRNPNAPVVRSNWLYKQDSTGMKMWKRRWFVLSDMCLFYYKDEKEEGILGSILLPSFRISMLSVDDHISKKYAFKATHPNMRTYYFCTDTAKDMESWMKVMTDAALVHTEPIRRLDKLKTEHHGPQEMNNILNHRALTQPEIQNNERNHEREKHAAQKDLERYGERYGFQKDGGTEQPLTKINSIKLQPAQAAAIAAAVSASRQMQAAQQRPPLLNGPGEPAGERSPVDAGVAGGQPPPLTQEPEKNLQRTGSTQQLEQWVRIQRTRGLDDETRSITSYQTLPRNMPSHRAQVAPRYPEGYRTLPRNSGVRPDSISSLSASVYDRALGPSAAEKRRSMRDDTMWQLYEWQQRQAHSRQHAYSTLPSPKQLGSIAERAAGQSIPTSPYHTYSPRRSYSTTPRSEVSSPVFRGDVTIDRRHRAHLAKCGYPPDRRSVPVQSITAQSLQGKTPEELTLLLIKLRRQQAELNSLREHTLAQLMQLNLDANKPKSEILSHHLQRNLMYVDGQMKESEPLIFMIHTMIENSAPRPQLYQQVRDGAHVYQTEEPDVDAKLSRLCEQDKVVRMQEDKLQQLHREKHTLETALLSASQEIEMSANNPTAVQTVIQQRDVLQSGLLSTCRELSRVNGELERSWREYDRLEAEVMAAKNNLLKQLEALGSPQTEPPSQKHIQIQKDLWRIQDVMEALNKNKPKRSSDPSTTLCDLQEPVPVPPRPPLPHSYEGGDVPSAAPPLPPTGGSQGHVPRPLQHRTDDRKSGQRNGAQGGPDYRLYKSEPELTTVAEVDESNGEDKTEQAAEKEPSSSKGIPYPVGIVPPRTKSPVMPESSTIASYVTLRKSKKPDPRTQDRPRSAVDQACLAEGGRTRMSVEEQMERIRRHQQGAALREKRRDQENSLSRSSSFSKDQIPSNPYYTLQVPLLERQISPCAPCAVLLSSAVP